MYLVNCREWDEKFDNINDAVRTFCLHALKEDYLELYEVETGEVLTFAKDGNVPFTSSALFNEHLDSE